VLDEGKVGGGEEVGLEFGELGEGVPGYA